jgi:hypothetical protein
VRLRSRTRSFHVLFRGWARGFYALRWCLPGSLDVLRLGLGNRTLLDLRLALRLRLGVVVVEVRTVRLNGFGAAWLRRAVNLRGRVGDGRIRRCGAVEVCGTTRLAGADGFLWADRIGVNGLHGLSGASDLGGPALVRLARTIHLARTTRVGLLLIRLTGAIEFTWASAIGLIGLDRLSGAVHLSGTTSVGLSGLDRLSGPVHLDGAVIVVFTRAVASEASADWGSSDAGGCCNGARGYDFGGTAVVGVE